MPATRSHNYVAHSGQPALAPAALPTVSAGAYVGVAPGTLTNWRSDPRGPKGPPFVKLGSGPKARIVYRIVDLDAWLAAHVQQGAV